MTMATPARPRARGRRRGALVAGRILILGLGVLAVWWLGGFSGRAPLSDFMRSEMNADIHPVEVTAEVCGERHCESAWRTEVGTFIEFRLEDDAEYWETVLGDGSRRNDRIIVDFSDHQLDRQQIQHAVDTLFSDRDWT